ncbi:MAG TPA: hypothetical protein VMG59_02280 [Phycisphaerae bacterium]|nr:hypothetical protein [Phycisphaerae bacterium]
MTETRIELISPKLRKRFDSATETQLRQVAYAVSRAIVERFGLTQPIITRALECLSRHELPTDDMQAEVQAYADEVDSAYLDLSDKQDTGRASQEQVSVAFSKARAASAVAFALADSALLAACEATYEAASAVDNATEITSIADKILSDDHVA